MSERPTLTISAPCPTCGGTGLIPVPVEKWTRAGQLIVATDASKCPDCTDGTIRQAVSCAGCKWFDAVPPVKYIGTCLQEEADMRNVDADFGCLSWEAKA